MADSTKIEWTDATWNPITGCSVVSPGCTNCYAMRLAGTRLAHHESRAGLTRDTKAGPVWTGEVRFNEQWIDQPLRWRKPRLIFVCAHGDLFAEGVPDEWIDRVFAVMALAPQHTFQVLTKRSARMREYMSAARRAAIAASTI
jgi:protein gp37